MLHGLGLIINATVTIQVFAVSVAPLVERLLGASYPCSEAIKAIPLGLRQIYQRMLVYSSQHRVHLVYAPGEMSSLVSSAMDVAGGRLESLSFHVVFIMHLGLGERIHAL